MKQEPVTAPVSAESKADAFRRLGKKRVKNVVTALRILGNLGNRNQYEYTPEQVSKIVVAVNDAVDQMIAKFADRKADEKEIDL